MCAMSNPGSRAGSGPLPCPRTPRDVPDPLPYADLATAVAEHRGRLVDARHGLGAPQPADQVATHALAALATAHALAERVLWARWCDARDELAHGATVDDVARAMELSRAAVRGGLRDWADGQQRLNAHYGDGGVTLAEADEVRALATEADR